MSHWYDSQGVLVARVPKTTGYPGETRETTLRDARKLLLYPSVTTVQSLLEKVMLTNWKMERVIQAALQGDSDNAKEIMRDAFTVVDEAAEFGTAVHAGINAGLTGGRFMTYDVRVQMVVDGFWPWYMKQGLQVKAAEASFVDKELGYAGTADWVGFHDGVPAIADFKTQEFEIDRVGAPNGPTFYDPEHPIQLAGYAIGLQHVFPGILPEKHKRLSIIISRTNPGLIVMKEWDNNGHYDQCWLKLLNLWQQLKNYWPGERGLQGNEHVRIDSSGSEEALEELLDNLIPFPVKG